MARYDYECQKCGRTFERVERMSEHETESAPECPGCGSTETRQVLNVFYPDTSDKA